MEAFSYKGTRVADDVKDKLGDVGGIQVTDTAILRWINNGQREIAGQHDFLLDSATTPVVALQSVYDLTDLLAGQRVKTIETVTLDGAPLAFIDFGSFLRLAQQTTADEQSGTPTSYTLRASILRLWPIPPTAGAELEVYYSQWPADLTALTESLSLPDRFYNALTDYVYAQALLLQEDWEAAGQVLAMSDAANRREFEKERADPNGVYPTLTILPEET